MQDKRWPLILVLTLGLVGIGTTSSVVWSAPAPMWWDSGVPPRGAGSTTGPWATVCSQGAAAVAGMALVGIQPGRAQEIAAIAALVPGGQVVQTMFQGRIALLRFDDAQTTLAAALATWTADPRVRYAEPNYVISVATC